MSAPPEQLKNRPRILHVEVGGTYGGSLRALELYLAHSDAGRMDHDLLFYFPTPNAECLAPHVGQISTLYSEVPAWLSPAASTRGGPSFQGLRRLAQLPALAALRSSSSAIRQLPTALRLAGFLRRRGYDLVHVNNTFTYQAPTVLAARLAGLRVVAHVRNPVPNQAFHRFLARRVHRLVSVAGVHSAALREMDPSLQVVTCRDALAPVSFDPRSVEELRRSLLNGGEMLVGSLGRLIPSKGFEFFVRAASLVVPETLGVCFALAGEGPQRKELEGLIQTFGLQDRFRLMGFRSDPGNFLAALDIFVCSSLWEGLPLTMLEAMQLGKPVVSTPAGGVSELIREGQNGLLVTAQDPRALKHAILQLVRDAPFRQRLGRAGSAAVEPFCDLQARSSDLDHVFWSALSYATEMKQGQTVRSVSRTD